MNTFELEATLEKLGRPRVLIVGDLILDRYVTGDVSRISPEAPIPILGHDARAMLVTPSREEGQPALGRKLTRIKNMPPRTGLRFARPSDMRSA